MARTPEQRAADSRLDDAIQACAEQYGFVPAGAQLVDYVVVLEAVRYDADPDEFDEFRGLLYRAGATRTTVALGLLRLGERMVGDEALDQGGGDL